MPLAVVAMTAAAMGARCGDGADLRLADGDVAEDTASYRALEYVLTSDNYNKWLRAQRALDSVDIDAHERISIRQVSDDDVDRVVRSLKSQPDARAAIESADISVEDFVLTTIALAQSWDAVNRPSARLVGAPPENLEFLRTRTPNAPAPARPRAAFLNDDDGESDSDRKRGKAKKNKRGKRNGSDSDS